MVWSVEQSGDERFAIVERQVAVQSFGVVANEDEKRVFEVRFFAHFAHKLPDAPVHIFESVVVGLQLAAVHHLPEAVVWHGVGRMVGEAHHRKEKRRVLGESGVGNFDHFVQNQLVGDAPFIEKILVIEALSAHEIIKPLVYQKALHIVVLELAAVAEPGLVVFAFEHRRQRRDFLLSLGLLHHRFAHKRRPRAERRGDAFVRSLSAGKKLRAK